MSRLCLKSSKAPVACRMAFKLWLWPEASLIKPWHPLKRATPLLLPARHSVTCTGHSSHGTRPQNFLLVLHLSFLFLECSFHSLGWPVLLIVVSAQIFLRLSLKGSSPLPLPPCYCLSLLSSKLHGNLQFLQHPMLSMTAVSSPCVVGGKWITEWGCLSSSSALGLSKNWNIQDIYYLLSLKRLPKYLELCTILSFHIKLSLKEVIQSAHNCISNLGIARNGDRLELTINLLALCLSTIWCCLGVARNAGYQQVISHFSRKDE